MPDPRPPDPGVEDPTTGAGGPGPEPAPAIDLSKPEEPAPSSPAAGGPLVSAPEPEGVAPVLSGEPPSAPPTEPPGDHDGPASPPHAAAPVAADAAKGSGGQAWKMALVVVVFLAVVVVAYVLGRSGGDDEPVVTATTTTTIDISPVDTSAWATFTDTAAGFTIKHPKDWQSLPIESAERLVLQAGRESAAQVTVRNIAASDAPDVIAGVMEGSKLVEEPKEFDLNGVPAIVYIYDTPIDEDSPDPGVAVQYFVVSPNKLYTLVFVTRPPEEINRLGRTFSAVAASLTITSEDPAPEPAPTTTTTTG